MEVKIEQKVFSVKLVGMNNDWFQITEWNRVGSFSYVFDLKAIDDAVFWNQRGPFLKKFRTAGFCVWVEMESSKFVVFLRVTKFKNNGRRMETIIPKGIDSKGWMEFGRLLESQLYALVDEALFSVEEKWKKAVDGLQLKDFHFIYGNWRSSRELEIFVEVSLRLIMRQTEDGTGTGMLEMVAWQEVEDDRLELRRVRGEKGREVASKMKAQCMEEGNKREKQLVVEPIPVAFLPKIILQNSGMRNGPLNSRMINPLKGSFESTQIFNQKTSERYKGETSSLARAKLSRSLSNTDMRNQRKIKEKQQMKDLLAVSKKGDDGTVDLSAAKVDVGVQITRDDFDCADICFGAGKFERMRVEVDEGVFDINEVVGKWLGTLSLTVAL
ncbi:unnamed protein product [Ilex paraguariensis]|uniref:Uncharacterized protein n=1 Tax=Ilex paraguariensis TaxID=185542 RepID=A0ABC8RF41_9AQUA